MLKLNIQISFSLIEKFIITLLPSSFFQIHVTNFEIKLNNS